MMMKTAVSKNPTAIKAPPPHIKGIMNQMVFSRCLSVAAELGIADLVGDEAKSIETISTELGTDENALMRLVRVLSAQGIFEVSSDGVVTNSEISDYLKEEFPGSQRNFARMMGSQWMWKVFNNLEHSIKTGHASFGKAFLGSENIFEYLKNINPKAGKVFSQAMSGFSYAFDQPLVNAYDFSNFKTVIDLGGAEGRLLKTIKKSYPNVNGILFELPDVIARVKTLDTTSELQYIGGDFFDTIEAKGDCIAIKYVLHNWSDEACIKILNNCRKAIEDNGKLLIMDMLIDEGSQQVTEKSMDIIMMLILGGKERTAAEFEALLSKTNFKLNKVIPTQCPLSILEIVPN